MMDQSDRHCRFLWRLISKHALLYTEMVTTTAILYGKDSERFLRYNTEEHPVALQLGGSDPAQLAECAKRGEEWSYDEINLNCGCPSDRVQTGRIGACLMAEPETVARCMEAMQNAVKIPVTIKHRIGIDDQDEEADLHRFVNTVAATGCETFIVHARKAWLDGLSPKQNRDIPPLLYERVYRLKQEFPDLEIILNGGICSVEESNDHLNKVDGVMVGRQAYSDPYFLSDVDKIIFKDERTVPSREEIVQRYQEYCAEQLDLSVPWRILIKPIFGMFHGQSGGKRFRRYLSQTQPTGKRKQDVKILSMALEAMTNDEVNFNTRRAM